MEPILAFDFWGLQLPVPVALAAVALFGYLMGSFRRRKQMRQEPLQARRELKRAQAVIKQLEKVSKEIRTNLATHQASILHFKDRVSLLNAQQKEATWNELCQEAERMLRPTMQLANQIANAYDEIRQQTNLLMSFSEVADRSADRPFEPPGARRNRETPHRAQPTLWQPLLDRDLRPRSLQESER